MALSITSLAPKRLPPIYMDRSTGENYVTCPFMANAVETGKVKGVGIDALAGSEGHRIIAEAIEWGKRNDDGNMAQYLWEELPKARPDLQPLLRSRLRFAGRALKRLNVWDVIAVEKQYAAEWQPGNEEHGAILLTICLDLVLAARKGEIVVIDWKTGRKHRSHSEAREAFQTQFGAWALWKNLPDVEKIHWKYIETEHDFTAYCVLERERDFHFFEGRIAQAVKLWQEKSQEAWPDPDKCAWCPATSFCPHLVGKGKELQDDPAAFFNKYMVMQAEASKMRGAMTRYCNKTGKEIDNGGGVIFGDEGRKKIMLGPFKVKEDNAGKESE